jgi:hypothetical protein
MNLKKILALFVLFSFDWFPASNQIQGESSDLILFFDMDAPVKMTILSKIDYIIKNRVIEELPARIIVTINEIEHEFDALIEVRGNFRKQASNCDFPPIRILFKKDDIKSTIFEGNRNIKIVTHCKNKSRDFLQYIAREYTIYQIYNLLNPYSLKVKMVDMTYVDVEGKIKNIVNPAFLIEDIENLAKNNKMTEFEGKVTAEDIDENNLLKLSIFQFMIGNTDWIIQFSKNLKFITDGDKILTIPYDFDYTAIADTDYNPEGNQILLSTPVRTYKGPCRDLGDLEVEFERLRGIKNEIYELISSSPYLKSGSKTHMKNYIIKFFDIIDSNEKVQEYFQFNCD